MSISNYCAELMKQNFNDSIGINYTPYAIMLFLQKKNYVIECDIKEITRFIYRFYIDNPDYRKNNSNILIKNISHYYVVDLVPYTIEQINVWIKNGDGILFTDNRYIWTNKLISNIKESEASLISKVIDSLSLRNFGKIIVYNPDLDRILESVHYEKSFDKYCEIINSTNFPNRAFESIDYCACCETYGEHSLFSMHLDLNCDLCSPDNSIVLCREHAKLYFEGYFRFDKRGRIIIYKKSLLLDSRMHLSIQLLKQKQKYLVPTK